MVAIHGRRVGEVGSPSEEERRMLVESRTYAARIRRPDLHRNYVIPVLSKALKIVQLLETSERPLSTAEIARRTGVPKTTAYRILRTLSAHGYLPQGADGVYCFKFISGSKHPGDCRDGVGQSRCDIVLQCDYIEIVFDAAGRFV